jgi:hypothetical protein
MCSLQEALSVITSWTPLNLTSSDCLVFDRANHRRENRAAGTTRDCLRDNAANTQIARLRCGEDRWQQQRYDLP